VLGPLLTIYPWGQMPKTNWDRPTQETEKGAEIPIPTREEVFRELGKVAKPRKPPPVSDVESQPVVYEIVRCDVPRINLFCDW